MKIRTIIAATCVVLAFSMAGAIYTQDSEAQTVAKNFEAAKIWKRTTMPALTVSRCSPQARS